MTPVLVAIVGMGCFGLGLFFGCIIGCHPRKEASK